MSISAEPSHLGVLIRLTVESGSRHLDIALADSICVAEIIPGVAARLGQLDCAIAHEGYVLARTDGTVLRPDQTLREQQVVDGERVVLLTAADQPEPRVYDDIVEAVGDAVELASPAWRPQDTAQTVVWTGVAFVVAAALALLQARQVGLLAAGAAGVLALLTLAAAAVMARVGEERGAVVAVVSATLVGAISGDLAAPVGPWWGWPLALASCGALTCALAGIAAVPHNREVCAGPAVAALMVGAGALVVAIAGISPTVVAAFVAAAAAVAGGAISWLALSASRLPVVVVPDRPETPVPTQPVDIATVRARVAGAQHLIVALRAGFAVVAVVTAPVVASAGGAGLSLVVCVSAVMALSNRRCHARAEVAVVAGGAVANLAAGLTAALLAHPSLSTGIILGLIATAAALVGIGMVPQRVRPLLGRLADAAQLVALVALFPLAAVLAGWV